MLWHAFRSPWSNRSMGPVGPRRKTTGPQRRFDHQPIVDQCAVPTARDERPGFVAGTSVDMLPRHMRIGDDDVVPVLAADRDLRV